PRNAERGRRAEARRHPLHRAHRRARNPGGASGDCTRKRRPLLLRTHRSSAEPGLPRPRLAARERAQEARYHGLVDNGRDRVHPPRLAPLRRLVSAARVSFASPFMLLALLVVPAILVLALVVDRRGARFPVAFTNLELLAEVVENHRSW